MLLASNPKMEVIEQWVPVLTTGDAGSLRFSDQTVLLVQQLLEHGANCNRHYPRAGIFPLNIVAKAAVWSSAKEADKLFELLWQHSNFTSRLLVTCLAAFRGHVPTLSWCLKSDAPFDVPSPIYDAVPSPDAEGSRTAFCWAARGGREEAVRYILNSEYPSHDDLDAALVCAVAAGSPECIRLLLDAGAVFAEADADGVDIVTAAARGLRRKLEAYLLVDISADHVNDAGESLLMLASKGGPSGVRQVALSTWR
eukprot:TRINITY_DN15220_c0_g1_i1.p1 TRINITY_DN15220_c0_g1~~TRINITY_DN15220_c0_g1_i1.p1  ORF type:complete len:254 (-),score=34.29 TRINITY_DN15220_c0_g1_i1:335-1096(-)